MKCDNPVSAATEAPIRSHCTVFFNDDREADRAVTRLRELTAVISSRVEPSVGVEVEFDPQLITEAAIMEALRSDGLLPEQVL